MPFTNLDSKVINSIFIPLFHDGEISINCKDSKIEFRLTFHFAILALISRQRQSQSHSVYMEKYSTTYTHFLFHLTFNTFSYPFLLFL